MHYDVGGNRFENALIPNVGSPGHLLGAQLGCGVVGIGCGDHSDNMMHGISFGADPAITNPPWPTWLKVMLGVGIAIGVTTTVVYFVTRN